MVKAVLKSIPIVGDVVDNLDQELPDSPRGKLNPSAMTLSIIRLVILGILLYLVFQGKLNMDDAEEYKEFLNQHATNPFPIFG